jgi:hypothetical protein
MRHLVLKCSKLGPETLFWGKKQAGGLITSGDPKRIPSILKKL